MSGAARARFLPAKADTGQQIEAERAWLLRHCQHCLAGRVLHLSSVVVGQLRTACSVGNMR